MRRNSPSPKRSSCSRSHREHLAVAGGDDGRRVVGTSRSGSRKNAATGAAASAGTSHSFDFGRAARARAARPSAMPAAATPLESMCMPRVSGTLDGRYAGAQLGGRRRVGRGEAQPVHPHRRLVAQHQVGADAVQGGLPVEFVGGAAVGAGQRGAATASTPPVGRGAWPARR